MQQTYSISGMDHFTKNFCLILCRRRDNVNDYLCRKAIMGSSFPRTTATARAYRAPRKHPLLKAMGRCWELHRSMKRPCKKRLLEAQTLKENGDVDYVIVSDSKWHHETLSSWAILEATSEDERSSSSTCFSTPRSTEIRLVQPSTRARKSTGTHQSEQTRVMGCRWPL